MLRELEPKVSKRAITLSCILAIALLFYATASLDYATTLLKSGESYLLLRPLSALRRSGEFYESRLGWELARCWPRASWGCVDWGRVDLRGWNQRKKIITQELN